MNFRACPVEVVIRCASTKRIVRSERLDLLWRRGWQICDSPPHASQGSRLHRRCRRYLAPRRRREHAIFSLVKSPAAGHSRIVNPNRLRWYGRKRDASRRNFGYATYLDWKSRIRVFGKLPFTVPAARAASWGGPNSSAAVASPQLFRNPRHPSGNRARFPAREDLPTGKQVVMLILVVQRNSSDSNIVGKPHQYERNPVHRGRL